MQAQDKFGNDLKVGDRVVLYYGGDRHVTVVTGLNEASGVPVVTAAVEATAPAGLVEIDRTDDDVELKGPATAGDASPPEAPAAAVPLGASASTQSVTETTTSEGTGA